MKPVLDILFKDLRQILRDPKTYLFLIIMPIAFTFLFGWAFGGFSEQPADSRLPITLIDLDHSKISQELTLMLSQSNILRLEIPKNPDLDALSKKVASSDLAAVVVIPEMYEQAFLDGLVGKIDLVIAPNTSAGLSIQNEVTTLVNRLAQSIWIVQSITQVVGQSTAFGPLLDQVLAAWNAPPIRLTTSSQAVNPADDSPTNASLAHSSPGMMLQFAIAGLLTAAAIIVNERKNRCLQRLLTTPVKPGSILLGHFLALLTLILSQFFLLILFGQWVLRVNYFQAPLATLIVALGSALCIASLGLLIGVYAKSEEQAIVFSLIPMFILSALGGAWVPLENTGKVFASIGRLTPVGLAMDGFKNILLRGLGIQSACLPFTLLAGYTLVFFLISLARFRKITH